MKRIPNTPIAQSGFKSSQLGNDKSRANAPLGKEAKP
jgi:hypothetical protein